MAATVNGCMASGSVAISAAFCMVASSDGLFIVACITIPKPCGFRVSGLLNVCTATITISYSDRSTLSQCEMSTVRVKC